MILNSLKRQFNNYNNKTYLLLLSIECEFMKIITISGNCGTHIIGWRRPKEIANTLNKFFTSCIENLRGENMSTSTNFNKLYNFVNDKISQNTQFSISPVKMNALLQDLLNLDKNKSTGTVNIGPKILKVSALFIVSLLTYIFNRIIDSGIYPNILKNAKVSPIFKSGEKCLPTNYICYIKTNWKTYLKTYVSVLGKIQSSTWCPIWF